MNRLTKLLVLSQTLGLASLPAALPRIQDGVLDEHLVYSVPVSTGGVTTVSFPSPIAAIDGALITTDGKTPALFQVAHTKGTAYFSTRALIKGATTNLNVRWNNKTFVFELKESPEPVWSLILRNAREKSHAPARPLTPVRLLGLLEKAKAFSLLQTTHPEAVRDVEYRDCREKPLVSDCGEYEVRLTEALRFPEQDTLVFRLTVTNKSNKVLQHTPEHLQIRVGDQVFTPSVADLASTVDPLTSVQGYVAVTGKPGGGRNDLSLKNDFIFVLSRQDAAIEKAAKEFEQIQKGGLAK